MKFTLRADEIARLVGGRLVGDATLLVKGLAPIQSAGSDAMVFLSSPHYVEQLRDSSAQVVLVEERLLDTARNISRRPRTWIIVPNVQAALVVLQNKIQAHRRNWPTGVEPQAHVAEDVELDPTVYVGAFAYVSSGCRIGRNVKIFPHVYLGAGCTVGDDTVLYSGVKVYDYTTIGRHCIIHSGAVIGSDGFGFVMVNGKQEKILQLGRVVIEDHVEIGANTVIDRATLAQTLIREGVKLDNLIQVAHNVTIGPYTVIAAQTGISGSAHVGAQCMIGGQVGIVGHIRIADGSKIGAKSGIAKSISEPGQEWLGTPALPAHQAKKIWYVLARLPEMYRALRRVLQKEAKE